MTAVRKEMIENAEDSENPRTSAGASKDDKNPRINLVQVLYIQYPILFQKKFILALLDLGNKVNAIYPNFAKKLRLLVRLRNIGA